jgi:8-oxo-dGTP diphosphatase
MSSIPDFHSQPEASPGAPTQPHPLNGYLNSTVRTAVRGVFIREGKILTVRMRDRDGVFYLLPGGGQKSGETMTDTLRRECMEELGVTIEIGEFLFVREYIGRNHDFSYRHANFHQVEVVFRCELDDPEAVRNGDEHDARQIGFAWLELATLGENRFFPKVLAGCVKDGEIVVPEHYLGDVN